jgi:hypothetical protein
MVERNSEPPAFNRVAGQATDLSIGLTVRIAALGNVPDMF